ncbi:hypothetical protein CS022_19690 [Veronia nyctiphanis]|uniref:DM13 domain-containing protein n=1 Tax=Veronia nyctiphanis TaxID=1278244 RepID=A0A4Q0YRQ5_9GAMM|nr:DM13 domain-containing protein [Veronia nyctiphanis]RXJ71789.1 hypothetical protein CS022_19690 [Veronia nyctiphanis]
MKKSLVIGLLVSHSLVLGIGFAAGLYVLPILIAPPPPDSVSIQSAVQASEYTGAFTKDREDSDGLHWGEGEVSIGDDQVVFTGELAPGPDYYLYFSPEFVETEADFNRLKANMAQVGQVKTFENFIVDLPDDFDPSKYKAVIVWCESFGQFITSAEYTQKK